jgi:hypothetical protein
MTDPIALVGWPSAEGHPDLDLSKVIETDPLKVLAEPADTGDHELPVRPEQRLR